MTDIHIRQLGDEVLHAVPPRVDFKNDTDKIEIDKAIMFEQLHLTGGVGIAANQCSQIHKPLQMIIVGTTDAEIRELVQQRYPDQAIPEPELIFNPKILEYGGESYFPDMGEGCLSVFDGFRGKVKRFTEVVLQHEKTSGEVVQETVTGFRAHITQHEYDHICGVVYLQKILNDIIPEKINNLLTTIESHPATKALSLENLTPLELIFDRDKDGEVIIVQQALEDSLPYLNTELWQGVVCELKQRLQATQSMGE